MAAYISWNPLDHRLVVRTPYVAGFPSALREALPASARRWNPDEKTWAVSPSYTSLLVEVLLDFYPLILMGNLPLGILAELNWWIEARRIIQQEEKAAWLRARSESRRVNKESRKKLALGELVISEPMIRRRIERPEE